MRPSVLTADLFHVAVRHAWIPQTLEQLEHFAVTNLGQAVDDPLDMGFSYAVSTCESSQFDLQARSTLSSMEPPEPGSVKASTSESCPRSRDLPQTRRLVAINIRSSVRGQVVYQRRFFGAAGA